MRPRTKPRPSQLDTKYGPLNGVTRLTNPLITNLRPKSKEYHLTDSEVRALKLKVTPKGQKSFLIRYRNEAGKERKYKLGVFPDMPAALARDQAKRKLAEVVQGGDPSATRSILRSDAKFKDFAERFMANHAEIYLRPSTVQTYRSALDKHINPAIGQTGLQSIARQQLRDLHQSLRATPYQANRVLGLIRQIFNKAEEWEVLPLGTNPATMIKKYSEETRDFLLSKEEMLRVADAIDHFRRTKPAVKASLDAITFLFLTGLRLNEALQLSWDDIDFERRVIVLQKTKTKPRNYQIVDSQESFLRSLQDESLSPFLFPHSNLSQPLKSVKKPWDWIREHAGIPGFRIHDIRHNFGSSMGIHADITSIAKVLGHTDRRTTERYVHAQSDNVNRHLSKAAGENARIFVKRSIRSGQREDQ